MFCKGDFQAYLLALSGDFTVPYLKFPLYTVFSVEYGSVYGLQFKFYVLKVTNTQATLTIANLTCFIKL